MSRSGDDLSPAQFAIIQRLYSNTFFQGAIEEDDNRAFAPVQSVCHQMADFYRTLWQMLMSHPEAFAAVRNVSESWPPSLDDVYNAWERELGTPVPEILRWQMGDRQRIAFSPTSKRFNKVIRLVKRLDQNIDHLRRMQEHLRRMQEHLPTPLTETLCASSRPWRIAVDSIRAHARSLPRRSQQRHGGAFRSNAMHTINEPNQENDFRMEEEEEEEEEKEKEEKEEEEEEEGQEVTEPYHDDIREICGGGDDDDDGRAAIRWLIVVSWKKEQPWWVSLFVNDGRDESAYVDGRLESLATSTDDAISCQWTRVLSLANTERLYGKSMSLKKNRHLNNNVRDVMAGEMTISNCAHFLWSCLLPWLGASAIYMGDRFPLDPLGGEHPRRHESMVPMPTPLALIEACRLLQVHGQYWARQLLPRCLANQTGDIRSNAWLSPPLSFAYVDQCRMLLAVKIFNGEERARLAQPLFDEQGLRSSTLGDLATRTTGLAFADQAYAASDDPHGERSATQLSDYMPDLVSRRVAPYVWQQVCSHDNGQTSDEPLLGAASALDVPVRPYDRALPRLLCGAMAQPSIDAISQQRYHRPPLLYAPANERSPSYERYNMDTMRKIWRRSCHNPGLPLSAIVEQVKRQQRRSGANLYFANQPWQSYRDALIEEIKQNVLEVPSSDEYHPLLHEDDPKGVDICAGLANLMTSSMSERVSSPLESEYK